MQLAILKLSDGNRDKLRTLLAAAKSDYRDVIGPAEYPGQSREGFVRLVTLSEAEKERISDEDYQQYLEWLEQ